MKKFEKSSRLKCNLDKLFHFHLGLNNLKTITPKDTKVTLLDVVEYKLPFGFLGNLFNFIIEYELKKMFDFRHEITKKLIEIS